MRLRINYLPLAAKELAFRNQVIQGNDKDKNIELVSTLDEGGFNWDDTPEGGDFWNYIYDCLKSKKIDRLRGVELFQKAFQSPILDFPQIPQKERALLRVTLLQEELEELKQAIEDDNLVEAFDAMLDIDFIHNGNILEFGMQDSLDKGFLEVLSSNMSKLGEDGKPIINGQNGHLDESRPLNKVLKSSNYIKPQLNDYL